MGGRSPHFRPLRDNAAQNGRPGVAARGRRRAGAAIGNPRPNWAGARHRRADTPRRHRHAGERRRATRRTGARARWRAQCGLSQSTVSRIWRAFGSAAASQRDVQAVARSAVHRQGPGHRRAVSEPAGQGAGAVRRREVADPGAGSQPTAAADAARASRAAHARLRAARHHVALCGLRRRRAGRVIGQRHRRHRAIEFRKFLDTIDATVPDGPRRPSHPGQLRHAQDGPDPALAREAPPLPPALHADGRVLDQSGRALVRAAHREADPARRPPQHPRARGRHRRATSPCTTKRRSRSSGPRPPMRSSRVGRPLLSSNLRTQDTSGPRRLGTFPWGLGAREMFYRVSPPT